MVALDNFEMSTYRLSTDCSSSELQGKLARELGIEPRLTESKSVVLPLHNSRTKLGSEEWTRTTAHLRMKEPIYQLNYLTI